MRASHAAVVFTGSDSAGVQKLHDDLVEYRLKNAQLVSEPEHVQAALDALDCAMIIYVGSDPALAQSALTALDDAGRASLPLMVFIGSEQEIIAAAKSGWFDMCLIDSMEPRRIYRRLSSLMIHKATKLRRSSDRSSELISGPARDRAIRSNATRPDGDGGCFQLVYVSRSLIEARTRSEARQLARIGEVSRKFNQSKGITGALMHHDGFFVQILEGESKDVLSLMAKIERDTRHFDVVVRQAKKVDKRLFGDWSLICFDMSKKETALPAPPCIPYATEPDSLIANVNLLVNYGLGKRAIGHVEHYALDENVLVRF